MQTRIGHRIDLAVEQLFEILAKRHDIQQRTLRGHVHEQIDVAVRAVIATPTEPNRRTWSAPYCAPQAQSDRADPRTWAVHNSISVIRQRATNSRRAATYISSRPPSPQGGGGTNGINPRPAPAVCVGIIRISTITPR